LSEDGTHLLEANGDVMSMFFVGIGND